MLLGILWLLAGYPLLQDMVEYLLLDNRANSCPNVHKDWVDHVVEGNIG